jgi:uncharacterized protein (DUF885 family)
MVWTTQKGQSDGGARPRYDIKDFHAAGLDCGRVPLEVLEDVISAWIVRSKA